MAGTSTVLVSLGEQKGLGGALPRAETSPLIPSPQGWGVGQAWCSLQGNWAEWINGVGRTSLHSSWSFWVQLLKQPSPSDPTPILFSNCQTG